ncbi:MAG: Calcineurin-like phosphoesterase [Firmicutes bacterium]|nr:Calcineurin-like phosphoesterase [Bacillota bacterium]
MYLENFINIYVEQEELLMKLLILHLSDAHFKNINTITRERREKIISSLSVIKKVDECLILFSGDIAYQGIPNEYKHAGHFLGTLVDGIKDKFNLSKYIKVFVTPGNHDLVYGANPRTSDTIEQYYKDKKQDEILLSEEPKLFEDFYQFACRNHCFKNNKILDQHFIQYNDLKIKVNLINSACFSTLDNDKGNHHLPISLIERLYINDYDISNNVNIAITVMHHNPEWFNEDIKPRFIQALFDGTSLLFLGHEHNPQNKKTILNDAALLNILGGGVLGDNQNPDSSSFNVVTINTANEEVEIYQFNWSPRSQIYKHKKVSDSKLIHKKAKGYKLFPTDSFYNLLGQDGKHKISKSFLDYFVFPRLSLKSIDKFIDNKEICDQETFLKELLEKRKIIIEGSDNTGKTTLLKYLYINLLKTKIPMLFSSEDIKDKSVNRLIKETFRVQYGEDESDFIKFQQIDSSLKVALVDDITKIKENTIVKFLSILNEEFDYIVISTKSEINLNLLHIAKTYFEENEFTTYQLRHFYSDKRRELIKNVTCLLKDDTNSQIDLFVKKTNDFIKNQFQLFRIDPDFIIQYIRYYIENNIGNTKNNNIFNIIFENNIVNAIMECNPQESVDIIFVLLEELAYFIHFHKKYPIKRMEFELIVKQYNDEYGQNVKIKNLYDVVTNAKILKDVGDSWDIKFCNNNYLAFFVARRLNRKYNEEHNPEDLLYILNNICFGINGDIILFLTYITQNTQILNSIYSAAESHMGSWDEFNFVNNNINFITRFKDKLKINPPDKSAPKNIIKSETESEKKVHSKEIIETVDIYDYNEEEVTLKVNQILKAIKYTEMIAKSLPNFSHILKREVKDEIVKNIYSYPNKIIYSWLHEIDNDFDLIIDDLELYINSKIDNSKKITKDKVGIILTKLAIVSILNIYDLIANISTDKKTISILNGYETKGNINYLIQNIMMEENIANIDSVIEKADYLYKTTKDPIIKHFIQQIIRKCLIYNDNIEPSKERYLRSKYFDNTQQQSLLLAKSFQRIK